MTAKEWDKLLALIPLYDIWRDIPADVTFDPKRAERVIGFIENCCHHIEGPLLGRPLLLQPWQKGVCSAAYGFVYRDGTRLKRSVWLECARKQGKSLWASALALYHLLCDNEPGPQVYAISGKARDQARVIFDGSKKMISLEPELINRTKVNKTAITPKNGFGVFKPLTSDADTEHGKNASAAFFDETWNHPNNHIWEAITTSIGARKNPMIWSCTTAGHDKETLAYERHLYAEACIKGDVRDPSHLPVLWNCPEDVDWTSEDVWRRYVPNLDVSTSIEFYRKEYAETRVFPSKEMSFRKLYLCQWVSQSERWIDMQAYDQCQNKYDLEALVGQPCYGGFDLGYDESMTAFSLFFPVQKVLLCWFWIPAEDMGQREYRDHFTYSRYVGDPASGKWIDLMPSNVLDYEYLEKKLRLIIDRYQPKQIAVDRAMQLPIGKHLQDSYNTLVPFGQGYMSMTYPCRHFEKMVKGKELIIPHNPTLRWSIDHTRLKVDHTSSTDSCKPIKANAISRTDGTLASLMAIGQSLIDYEEVNTGIWWIKEEE